MSNFIKTSITLTEEDKEFLKTNYVSLSKLIRKTINEQRNDQAVSRKTKLPGPLNHTAKRGSK